MGLDKANIFKPNDNELTKYQNDPFLDYFESTKVFAKALKNDIDTKETRILYYYQLITGWVKHFLK